MRTKLNRKGVACYAPTFTVGLTLALSFIFSCTSNIEMPPPPEYGDTSSSSSTKPSSSSLAPSSSSVLSSSSQLGIISGAPVNYDDEIYETVVIGTQTWFNRNLNYNPSTGTSVCYSNEASNCDKYGRLYDWSTAMALSSSCNSSICSGQVNAKHKGICPSGWHIPSNADWDKLMRYVDGTSGTESPYDSKTAGRYLKAASGWNNGSSGWNSGGNDADAYGFSALPGGYGYSSGNFDDAGYYGIWWSASESYSYEAYTREMYCNDERAYWNEDDKSSLFSVRCVKD